MSILSFLSQQSGIEWAAFLFGVAYVILAARENIWCWFFGLISVILYFVVFIEVKLYSDATLQVFYMAMSVYGWWSWRKTGREGENLEKTNELNISTLPVMVHLVVIISGSILAVLLGYFWKYMGASLPFIDAYTTSFGIIATILVARKKLENWIYWIVIDSVCVGVYIYKEIYLTALLFLIYTIIAIIGYLSWRKHYLSEKSA